MNTFQNIVQQLHYCTSQKQPPNCKLAIILFSFSVYPFAHGTDIL